MWMKAHLHVLYLLLITLFLGVSNYNSPGKMNLHQSTVVHTCVTILLSDDSMVLLTKEGVALEDTCCNRKFRVFLTIFMCDGLE